MARSARNPFEYGRELALAELVDRSDEMKQVEVAIRNRGKLFLIGPRRYGKTSLLSAAGEAAAERGVAVLRFDAEKFESLERLAAALLSGATRALKGPLERTLALLGRVAARLRPEAKMEADGKVSVSLGVSAEVRGELPLLIDTLDAIEALAAESGQEVVVILDEIQRIVVEHGFDAERQLRSTVQGHSHVGYIFAGSATRLLNEMTSDPDRPFYRLGARLFLGAVPRPDFVRAMEERFLESGLRVEAGACEHILERAADVPYNVQRLAHEAWEMVRDEGGEEVTAALVDAALERVVRREDPAYTQVWINLRKNQRLTLKAVIDEGGESMFRAEVARRTGTSTASLQKALDQLEQLDLIRREHVAGSSRWVLVDPFFAAWLKVAQAG
jgi:AAA+ ATPase superfamily predicted ATPase